MYNIEQAQRDYFAEEFRLGSAGIIMTEIQQAVLFAKILISQGKPNITFCSDSDLFVSKTPTGYDVVGFYFDPAYGKVPFNITVFKANNMWYLSQRYVAPDTKSCSGSILLWVLLCVGCSLMGVLMYYFISFLVGM